MRPRSVLRDEEQSWLEKDPTIVAERSRMLGLNYDVFRNARIPSDLEAPIRNVARSILGGSSSALSPGPAALRPYFPILWRIPFLREELLRLAASGKDSRP